jgi:Rieske 2Fe-2S family protein
VDALRRTLPAVHYVDPGGFAREAERIFAGMWVNACRLEQVASRGQFVCVEFASASLLVVGDGARGARAFHNVCRHRGTRLCVAAEGTLAGSIQCPYHAWTYDLDGRLIGAPLMEEVEGFRAGDFPLRRAGCEVWDGHVFVNLALDPSSLAAQLGDLPSRFAPWHMSELVRVHVVEYDVRANWKLIVQNYNECLHCPVIHPLLNRMHHYLGAENVPSTGSYCGGAMGFRAGVETLSTDGRRRRAILPGLGPAEAAVVNYFVIYPNLLLTLHPDYMLTVRLWPVAPDRTRLISEWHVHPDEAARPDFVIDDAVEFWDLTNREDWAICERSQQGIQSRGYTPGPYSRREMQLWEFDQFVLGRMAEGTS